MKTRGLQDSEATGPQAIKEPGPGKPSNVVIWTSKERCSARSTTIWSCNTAGAGDEVGLLYQAIIDSFAGRAPGSPSRWTAT